MTRTLSAPGNGAKLPQGSTASTVARALSGCMQSTDKPGTQVPWDTARRQARQCFLCPPGKPSRAGKAPACPRALTCYHELHVGPDLALGPVGGDAGVVPRVAPAHLVEGQDASIVADVGWQAAPICRAPEEDTAVMQEALGHTAASPTLEVGQHQVPVASGQK